MALFRAQLPISRYLFSRPISTVSFDDFQNVYKFKTTKELMRSYFILRLCGINFFVDYSLQMMKLGHRIMGQALFAMMTRPLFYKQFVGGDTETELKITAKALLDSNVRLMVCPVQEEDIDDGSEGNGSEKYDANLEYIKNTAGIMSRCGTSVPNLQLKITAFMPATLVVKLTSLVQEDPSKKLAFVQGIKESFDHDYDFSNLGLEESEMRDLKDGIKRLKELCDFSLGSGLRLLVDAEYTYMNDGISLLALGMMAKYNKDKALIGNTYQCYLKVTYDKINEDYAMIAKELNAKFGAKIVRGAYMEKERKLAKLKGYPDPVNDDYEATGEMYFKVVSYLMQKEGAYMVIATHNEESVKKIVATLPEHCRAEAVFAQIYGMGEQITMPLANDNFIVYKSVPYGPLEEVLPYLSRRVAENRSVLAGARKERNLLASEIYRRLFAKSQIVN